MPRTLLKLALGCFGLGLSALRAQEAQPTVEKVLAQMQAYGREYRAKLPSLTCEEAITSQTVKNGQVRKTVEMQATLRELRSANDEFLEKLTFRDPDGHPIAGRVALPFFVQGGFANAIGFIGKTGPETAQCFDYRVSMQDEGRTLRFEVTLRDGASETACSELPKGYRKTVWIERESGRVTRVERTISADAAKKSKEIYFASLTYGPQTMGDEILWLPVEMSAHDAKDEGRMLVKYSNYRRYVATSTIVQEP